VDDNPANATDPKGLTPPPGTAYPWEWTYIQGMDAIRKAEANDKNLAQAKATLAQIDQENAKMRKQLATLATKEKGLPEHSDDYNTLAWKIRQNMSRRRSIRRAIDVNFYDNLKRELMMRYYMERAMRTSPFPGGTFEYFTQQTPVALG
jgi:hypothetical protein